MPYTSSCYPANVHYISVERGTKNKHLRSLARHTANLGRRPSEPALPAGPQHMVRVGRGGCPRWAHLKAGRTDAPPVRWGAGGRTQMGLKDSVGLVGE